MGLQNGILKNSLIFCKFCKNYGILNRLFQIHSPNSLSPISVMDLELNKVYKLYFTDSSNHTQSEPKGSKNLYENSDL